MSAESFPRRPTGAGRLFMGAGFAGVGAVFPSGQIQQARRSLNRSDHPIHASKCLLRGGHLPLVRMVRAPSPFVCDRGAGCVAMTITLRAEPITRTRHAHPRCFANQQKKKGALGHNTSYCGQAPASKRIPPVHHHRTGLSLLPAHLIRRGERATQISPRANHRHPEIRCCLSHRHYGICLPPAPGASFLCPGKDNRARRRASDRSCAVSETAPGRPSMPLPGRSRSLTTKQSFQVRSIQLERRPLAGAILLRFCTQIPLAAS